MNATDFTSEPIGYSPLVQPLPGYTLDEHTARIVRRAQYLAVIEMEKVVNQVFSHLSKSPAWRGLPPEMSREQVNILIREVAANLNVPLPQNLRE